MPISPEEKGFGQGSPELARWAEKVFQPEDAVLAEIRARSIREGLPAIAVGRFDGLHLEVLARLVGARKAVEIGGMPEEGVLHTFELDPHHAEVARESFRKAGVASRAHIHVGSAKDKLREVEHLGPFDLCFLDADKTGYSGYLDWAARHLRVGGAVLADNAFGFGGVSKSGGDEAVKALRRFNEELAQGGRFRATMIPTEEGLALGVKVR